MPAALANRDPDELPHLRSVLADSSSTRASFPEQLATVLAGVAVRRGEDWHDVAGQVLQAGGHP